MASSKSPYADMISGTRARSRSPSGPSNSRATRSRSLVARTFQSATCSLVAYSIPAVAKAICIRAVSIPMCLAGARAESMSSSPRPSAVTSATAHSQPSCAPSMKVVMSAISSGDESGVARHCSRPQISGLPRNPASARAVNRGTAGWVTSSVIGWLNVHFTTASSPTTIDSFVWSTPIARSAVGAPIRHVVSEKPWSVAVAVSGVPK